METRSYNYYYGRKITNNGFMQAYDFNNHPVVFQTKYGKIEPIMIGVTEFGVPGIKEFKRNENHLKSHKVPAHFILWLPDADGPNHGVTFDGAMYLETQEAPEKYPERVQELKKYGVSLNINCK